MQVFWDDSRSPRGVKVYVKRFTFGESLVLPHLILWVCQQQRTGKYIGWF